MEDILGDLIIKVFPVFRINHFPVQHLRNVHAAEMNPIRSFDIYLHIAVPVIADMEQAQIQCRAAKIKNHHIFITFFFKQRIDGEQCSDRLRYRPPDFQPRLFRGTEDAVLLYLRIAYRNRDYRILYDSPLLFNPFLQPSENILRDFFCRQSESKLLKMATPMLQFQFSLNQVHDILRRIEFFLLCDIPHLILCPGTILYNIGNLFVRAVVALVNFQLVYLSAFFIIIRNLNATGPEINPNGKPIHYPLSPPPVTQPQSCVPAYEPFSRCLPHQYNSHNRDIFQSL